MTDLPLDVIALLGLLVLVAVLLNGGPLSGVTDTAPETDPGPHRRDDVSAGPAPN